MTHLLIFHSEVTCQVTERSPNWTINHLPNEMLLEIFNSYRQEIDPYPYNYLWREKYEWFNLIHVCRKWRAIILASASRLDLCIIVEPGQIPNTETIVSGPFPILVDYKCKDEDIPLSPLCRLNAALEQHDRVREISFEGTTVWFHEFFKATNFSFPVLESLVLRFLYGHQPMFPDTFLGGPNLPDLQLRRLELHDASFSMFPSITRILLSATALTHLFMRIDTAETNLLACLQGMPCLRSLDLSISFDPPGSLSTPKDMFPLKIDMFSLHWPWQILGRSRCRAFGPISPGCQD